MRSNTLMVSQRGKTTGHTTDDAMIKVFLKESEKVASENNFTPKQAMHLRLLTEELICMVPQIVKYGSGEFWIEYDEEKYALHIKVVPNSDIELPKKTDQAQKGLLRRISETFDSFVKSGLKGVTRWSLREYIDGVKKTDRNSNANEWDELEQSILASIADDVMVISTGSSMSSSKSVEVVVKKYLNPLPVEYI